MLAATGIPVSYFNDYQGMNLPSSPYTLSFSSGRVWNGGTAYFIGNMVRRGACVAQLSRTLQGLAAWLAIAADARARSRASRRPPASR